MSVTATIKTRKRAVDLKAVLIGLAEAYGYGIVAKELVKDFALYYLGGVSTRPIEISKVTGGWDVRITTLASEEDYEAFARTIEAMRNVTGGKVMSEDDEPVEDPLTYYGEDWRLRQMDSDASAMVALSYYQREDGRYSDIELYGPVCEFCVGVRLLNELGITRETDARVVSRALIERFRYSQHGRPLDIRRTTTNMQIKTESGDETMTYYIKNEFDMISYAKYILIAYDMEDMAKAVLLKYEDFMGVVPADWERFDNCQYYTTELSDKEFDDFINRARPYNLIGKKY